MNEFHFPKLPFTIDDLKKVGVGILIGAGSLFGIAVFMTRNDDQNKKEEDAHGTF